jgi:hypothetical protein
LSPDQTACGLSGPAHQLAAHRPASHANTAADQRPQSGTGCDSSEHRQRLVSFPFLVPVGQILENVHFVCPLRGALLQHR